MKYRIIYHRDDMPDYATDEFTAPNDKAAIARFNELARLESNSWSNMKLEKVVVVEKTERIAINDNMKRYLERDD